MTYYYGKNSGEKDDRRRLSLAKWKFVARPETGNLKEFQKIIAGLKVGEEVEDLKKFHIYAQGWSGTLNYSMLGTSDIEKIQKNESEFIIFTGSRGEYVLNFNQQS